MAWEGSHDVGADVIYEPLPEMDSEELERLRAIVGVPHPDGSVWTHGRSWSSSLRVDVIDSHRADRPEPYLAGLLEEVDRKLEKLLETGPVTIVNQGFERALVSVYCEISEMRSRLQLLQASVDRLSQSMVGD